MGESDRANFQEDCKQSNGWQNDSLPWQRKAQTLKPKRETNVAGTLLIQHHPIFDLFTLSLTPPWPDT